MGSTQIPRKLREMSRSARFRAALSLMPRISAREACSWARVPYNKKNAGLFYRVKSDRKRGLVGMLSPDLTATPSTPTQLPFHAATMISELPAEVVANIVANSAEKRSWSRWYRSKNRNRQHVFTNKRVLAMLWPTTRYFQVQCKGDVTEAEARRLAASTLLAGKIPEDQAVRLSMNMAFAQEHTVISLPGPVPRFSFDGFKDSLGQRIYADKSHGPYAIEVATVWPGWTRSLIPALNQFSAEIETHLKVQRATVRAMGNVKELKESVDRNTEETTEMLKAIRELVDLLKGGAKA